jgi:short-subunit dehydrogenase/uncharacterized membrane protein
MNPRNKGKLALVTGASTGIGFELAKCCAADGFDLVVAADEPEIRDAAEEFRLLGVNVEAVEADLATKEGVDKFCAATERRPIDALLANAGVGLGGAFTDQDFDDIRHVIDTNITGTVYLAQKVSRDMRARGQGRILFTGSIAGFTPGTFNAVYNATKAFIDSFSFALRNELKDTGVTVTCLMPGATETEFFERAGMLDTKIGQSKKDDPVDVAKVGYEAMMNGEGDVVAGWKNKVLSTAALFTPADVLAEQHRKKAEPGSADISQQLGRLTMQEKHLTREEIDSGVDNGKKGMFAKAAQHPVLTGGFIIAGAGLAYAAVKMMSSSDIANEKHIETSITIDKTPEELYRFWREFKNLPLFMKNLKAVTELDGQRSHWVATGLGGSTVEWDAEIINEKENELIAWRSLENADVVNAGSVRFQRGPEGHGTFIRVTLNYNPPAGRVGTSLAKLFGGEPAQLIKDDLRRLKQLMETGEIATIAGQTSGRASESPEVLDKPATMGGTQGTGVEANSKAYSATGELK